MAKTTRVAKSTAGMKPYFYRARCTAVFIDYLLRNPAKFQVDMRASVEAFGGVVLNCKIVANSGGDPIGFLMFPSDIAARSWNTNYLRRKGIQESNIFRLLDDDDLQEMKEIITHKGKYKGGSGGY